MVTGPLTTSLAAGAEDTERDGSPGVLFGDR